jgi:general secretion pathway protein K
MTLPMKLPAKQKGIALLTVLLVFALAAFISRDMLLTGFTDTQRQIALKDSRQAFYYALGGEAFARELLWRDRDEDIEQGRNVDSKSDDWYSRELAFPLDEGQLKIRVIDLQSRFNLTNLRAESGVVDAVAVAQLRRLFSSIDVEPDLAYRLADWVDEDHQVGSRGAEDEVYLKGDIPSLSANTALAELSEINSLASLSEQQYQDMRRHLTTLPERTKLNVNTVTVEVISALADRVNERGASALAARQDIKSYHSVARALSETGLAPGSLASYLGTSSDYYQIEVIALYRKRSARLRSVVHRQRSDGKTRVIYRSQQGSLKAG